MRAACVLALAILLAFDSSALGIAITEIHYHPPAGQEGLEFIELTCDATSPEDLSGYYFSAGIQFEFPAETILLPGESIAVCGNVDLVKAHYGVANAIGNFVGKLDSAGETVTLVNQAGVEVKSLSYRDEGKWPTAPDGAGHSLVLRRLHLDVGEPESWTYSPELGGSPGRANFSDGKPQYRESTLVGAGETWRYAKGTQAFSEPESAWRNPGFDDSSWLQGPSGFGFADNDDQTLLADMINAYVAVAIRKRFQVTAEQLEGNVELLLGIDFDDGFCAFLNDREIARVNCPPDVEPVWNQTATLRREAGEEQLIAIPREAVVAGENVLAIVGYNFRLTDNDFSLIPRVVRRQLIESPTVARPPVVFNELFRPAVPGGSWVELYNAGDAAVSLAGLAVTDDPERTDPYRFPAAASLPPRGFLVLGQEESKLALDAAEVRLFLVAADGYVVTASVWDKEAPAGWTEGFADARFPDGGLDGWATRTPTPGAANQVARTTDVVINEIFYNPPLLRRGEFLELHNKGAQAIDLGGFALDRGVDFVFPPGTTIPAGGYLVVAEDPAALKRIHGVDALGPFEGRLADAGENVRLVDAAGNLACEVRYFDGGTWPQWTDGGGSSLELVDASQDLSSPLAWEHSFEEDKAPWEEYKFHVANYTQTPQSELHLFLQERGVCRVDDIAITRDGGENLIPNPGFEVNTLLWTIQGTHVRSRRVTTDFHTGVASLEIDASAKGDTLVNRIETDTRPAMTRGPYDVALWARWIRGGSLLVVHGEYSAGSFGGRPSPAINLSGNSLSAGIKLRVPENLGTPGVENSATRRQRESTGSANLGPVIDGVKHSPATPPPGAEVPIRARVSDGGGVASVAAFWRVNAAADPMQAVELFDDGAHGDDAAGDGIYGGKLPAQVARTKVVYYIEATDGAGAKQRYPREAPARTLLYMHGDPAPAGPAAGRVILDASRTAELQTRPLHSNDLVDAAFVFDDEESYYNVGVRYRGSPWGRPSRLNYRVRFEDDKRFRRGRKAINCSSRGSAHNEGSAYYLIGRIGVPESPVPFPDYMYFRLSFNGGTFANYGMIQPIDRDFLTKWYGDSDPMPVLKAEGRRQFNDAQDLGGMWDGASFTYRQDEKENHRGYFIPGGAVRSIDDWSSLMALCKVMDRRASPDPVFDAEIANHMDVEEFLRDLAGRILTSDWDAFCVGNGHNGFVTLDPRDGRWELLPFDVDNTFSNANVALFPGADPDILRFMNRPWARRLYYRILSESLERYWSATATRTYFSTVQTYSKVPAGTATTYLTTNTAVVRNGLRSVSAATLKVITNGGEPFTTDLPSIEIEGEAPLLGAMLVVASNRGEPEALEPTWINPVRWKATFELTSPETVLDFTSIDRLGDVIGTASFTVRKSEGGAQFLRGDLDGSGALSVTDAIRVLLHLFGGSPVVCEDAADLDDSGQVDLTDAVNVLRFLFQNGSAPAAPFPAAGFDPTPDELRCAS